MCSVNNNIRPTSNNTCMCYKQNSYNTVIKSCCIIYFLLFLSLDVHSQNSCDNSISGKILDSDTQKPLSDVLIKEINSDKFSISDVNGNFLLENLCPEEDSLLFSRIGYQNSLISIDEDFWTISLTEE